MGSEADNSVAASPHTTHELRSRVTTAVVLLPLVGFLLWRGGWFSALLLSFTSATATREFLRLGAAGVHRSDAAALACAALLPLLPFWAPQSASELALLLVALASLFAWAEHVLREDVDAAPRRAPMAVQSLVFCALGMFFLASLRARPDGLMWVTATIAATFANDAVAFAVGRRFGRHRLAPRVSPGKTWEGFGAGALGAAMAMTGAKLVWPDALSTSDAIAIAAVCTFFGPLGDLSKSLLKRAYRVKDFSQLLPGHGGMLDRVDALLVNATLVWAWVRFQW